MNFYSFHTWLSHGAEVHGAFLVSSHGLVCPSLWHAVHLIHFGYLITTHSGHALRLSSHGLLEHLACGISYTLRQFNNHTLGSRTETFITRFARASSMWYMLYTSAILYPKNWVAVPKSTGVFVTRFARALSTRYRLITSATYWCIQNSGALCALTQSTHTSLCLIQCCRKIL